MWLSFSRQSASTSNRLQYRVLRQRYQVRSDQCLTCTFRASCCSARLSREQVPGQEKRGKVCVCVGGGGGGGGAGPPALSALSCTMEGRKEMFYLMTHSTRFIYGYMALYRHMVKDHSDSEKGNPHWLLFPISSKGSFICTIPQTG